MGLVFGWLARRLGWVRDVDFGAREGVAGTIRKGGGSHQFIWVSFLTSIFHLIFEILKIHASPTLILPRQKFIHFSKNQPPPKILQAHNKTRNTFLITSSTHYWLHCQFSMSTTGGVTRGLHFLGPGFGVPQLLRWVRGGVRSWDVLCFGAPQGVGFGVRRGLVLS